MTQHSLDGRLDTEVTWFERRNVMKAAAAWMVMGGMSAAVAQQRSNVVQLTGDALVNGSRLMPSQTIQTGDEIQTGPGSNLVFVMGNSSFLVRQNSRLTVERGATLNTVSLLRLVTGAVASVWNKGGSKSIITPTLTAGIRGTGVYAEVMPASGGRTYFCNCYGTVEIDVGGSQKLSEAQYHQAFWAEPEPNKDGRRLTSAGLINHTDAEQEFLAGLINQRTTWQITGRKANADGSGAKEYGPT